MKDLKEMSNLERALVCVEQAKREVGYFHCAHSSLSGSILTWDSTLTQHCISLAILALKEGIEHEERWKGGAK